VGGVLQQNNACNNLLTAWSRFNLEKLRFSQLFKKLLCILWNLKVHYHVYRSPTPVHILNQINPVQGDTDIYAEIF